MWLDMRNHSANIHKVLSLVCKNTDDSKKEIYKILMRSIFIERNIDANKDILEQCIDIMNCNNTWKDPFSEFEREVIQIYNICKQKKADSYEVDFTNDEDIRKVKLINKYEIEFPNTKSVTVKSNNKGLKEMKMFISNSFPSQLSSFTFIGNCEEEGRSYHFNSDRFRCVECLKTTNSSVLIQNYIFDKPKQLCDSIQFFKKARSIEFKDCDYKDCEVGTEDIKFEVVQFKQVVFTNCWFTSTKIIRKVIIDSGLAKILDKVTFNGFIEGKEDVEKMVQEYKNATGKINMEVI